MRFDCKLTGFENNWIDVEERWTRKEIGLMANTNDPAVLVDWIQRKAKALYIETIDGDPITDPADLTLEVIDETVDVRLYDFLGTVLIQAVGELRTLGPLSGRLSSKK